MRDIVYEMMRPKEDILIRKAGCIVEDAEFTLTFKYEFGAHYVVGIRKIEPEELVGDCKHETFVTKFFANRYFNRLMEKYPFKEEEK